MSDTEIPVSKVWEFLDSVLRQHGAVTLNPYAPAFPGPGQIVRVVDVDEANRRDIPVTDRVRTQIIPLKAVTADEVQKELGEVLRKAMEPDGHMAISADSNSVILTGRSDGINRAARILRVIDVSPSAEIQIRVFSLKNADATEIAKALNEVFKREAIRTDAGALPRMPAGEMVRITADSRTNSVIVSATQENMKAIKDLIGKLDDKGASTIRDLPPPRSLSGCNSPLGHCVEGQWLPYQISSRLDERPHRVIWGKPPQGVGGWLTMARVLLFLSPFMSGSLLKETGLPVCSPAGFIARTAIYQPPKQLPRLYR